MALPAKPFESDLVYLHLLPADREASRVRHALAGVDVEALYRTARADVWQCETFNAPRVVRRALARNGVDVLTIEPDDDMPGTLYYVRFCPDAYCVDGDWPPAPYYPRPADWPREWPWERPVATPSHDPAYDRAQQPGKLIPVPDCPGLDHSYAQMGMVDPTPVIAPDPEPPATPAQTIQYAQRRLPVDQIIRTPAGSVFARVNISTTARPMWHHILVARMTARATRQEAA